MKNLLKAFGNKLSKDLLIIEKENQSMMALRSFLPAYFPRSSMSIRYQDLEMLVNQVMYKEITTVLETGCGLSTLSLAKYFKYIGKGKVTALENDLKWLELIQSIAERDGISEFIRLIHCPTRKIAQQEYQGEWYDKEVYEKELAGQQFELFILDGPNAHLPHLKHSRVLSGLLVEKYKSSNILIYLDDFEREGDRLNLENLIKGFNLKIIQKNQYAKGIVLSSI